MPIIRRKNGDYAPSEYTMSAGKYDPTTLSITIEEKAIRGKPKLAPLYVAGLVVRFSAMVFKLGAGEDCEVGIETPEVMEHDSAGRFWRGPRNKFPALSKSDKWRVASLIDGGLVLVRTAQ